MSRPVVVVLEETIERVYVVDGDDWETPRDVANRTSQARRDGELGGGAVRDARAEVSTAWDLGSPCAEVVDYPMYRWCLSHNSKLRPGEARCYGVVSDEALVG